MKGYGISKYLYNTLQAQNTETLDSLHQAEFRVWGLGFRV